MITFFALKPGTVACAAVADTATAETRFSRDAEMAMLGAGGQQHRLGFELSPTGLNHDRIPRNDIQHFLPGVNLNILQRMADHDIHQCFTADLGEARIIFDDGGGGDLPPECVSFYNGGPQPAADRVDTRRQTGRPPTHDHHVVFDQLGIAFRNKEGLGFQFL
jgi:hypothetical protein